MSAGLLTAAATVNDGKVRNLGGELRTRGRFDEGRQLRVERRERLLYARHALRYRSPVKLRRPLLDPASAFGHVTGAVTTSSCAAAMLPFLASRPTLTLVPPHRTPAALLARITQQLAPALGYSLELPVGWTVILDTSSGLLRAVLAATVRHREDAAVVELGNSDFCLRLDERSSETILEAHAEARMKRHLPQGEPERFMDVIGGCPAFGYTWTDGVQEIATWFVEPVPTAIVRIDHAIGALGTGTGDGSTPRDQARALLATLQWTARSPT